MNTFLRRIHPSVLSLLFTSTLSAAPLGTAFTYQGRLTEAGQPATGSYDLRLAVYAAASGGSPLAGPLTHAAVPVTNGLFTIALDFGPGVFDGEARWLELAVRTNGGGAFAVLVPRQELTAAPYALFASNAAAAATLSGDPIIYGNTVFGPASGPPFVVNNSERVPNLNADLLDSRDSSEFWQTGGNSGTVPGPHFLGTTDNQPLELKVDNMRALRLEPREGGRPNVIGGSPGNCVSPGVFGATIGGGGALDWLGTPNTNRVVADFGTIGGGLANAIGAYAWSATIAGGSANDIGATSSTSVIGGGCDNNIEAGSMNAAIAGGIRNNIGASSSASTIGGGQTITSRLTRGMPPLQEVS